MAVHKFQTEKEWLENRFNGIGGSDAPIIMGLCQQWKSTDELLQEKISRQSSVVETDAMHWGKILEPVIAKEFREKTKDEFALLYKDRNDGIEVYTAENYGCPFLMCTPDGVVKKMDGSEGIWECKTTNSFNQKEWQENSPLHYQVQVQHEMMVMDYDWGIICVLIGGQELRWFKQRRNDRFIHVLLNKEIEFWDAVQSGETRQFHSNNSNGALDLLTEEESGKTIELPFDSIAVDEERTYIMTEIRNLCARKEILDDTFKNWIGENTFGMTPSGVQYKLRTVHNKGYVKTVEPYSYQLLTRKELSPQSKPL